MWKSSSYEVMGRYHLKHGLPCQDKTYRLEANGATVIALADGAGSAKDSEQGATTAVHTASEFIATQFEALYQEADNQLVKLQVHEAVVNSLKQKSQKLNCQLADLASTLLVVAVKEGRFLMVHLGDGVIGYLKGSDLGVASYPQNGEFANVTVFTTSPDALTHMKVSRGDIAGIQGFVLLSDGATASLYNPREKLLATPLKEMIRQNNPSFLKRIFDEFIVNRTTDDCSIAVMSKTSA